MRTALSLLCVLLGLAGGVALGALGMRAHHAAALLGRELPDAVAPRARLASGTASWGGMGLRWEVAGVDARGLHWRLTGTGALQGGGTARWPGPRAQASVEMAPAALPALAGLGPEGTLRADLRWDGGPHVDAVWPDAVLGEAALGTLRLTVRPDGAGWRGTLVGEGPDLAVEGRLVPNAHGVGLALLVTPRGDLPPLWQRLLPALGTAEGPGWRIRRPLPWR